YLPQPAGELFAATPTSQYANNPLQGLLILGAWLLVIGGMASLRFLKTDLGGRY
ncbi:lantibiotic ABC transporter permease, partial [Streptococcus pneumoniae]|nr:lantibiotic ABC transporter permease [Streptococcus pneumoniae]